MKIFITGATGYIGSRLALRLADEGHEINALYRDDRKTESIKHSNIHLFKGDILDYDSLVKPLEGCEQVYHTAAYAKVWQKDNMQIYRQNIEGAMNVIRAGIKAGVKRIVCTSTAGVLGYSINGRCSDENTLHPQKYFLDYECSKRIMEESIKTLSASGTDVLIVSPTRVYGPGLLSDSNGVTRLMQQYLKGKWRIIPGNGKSIGNYVFVDDVVTGHIQAMANGRPGEKYLLGGTDLTYDEFFDELAALTGQKYAMVHIPIPVSEMAARLMLTVAKVTGKAPLITPSLVKKYSYNWSVSSAKAIAELNYNPTDFKTGAGLTIDWLKTMN
ncbi:MAG TPA: NAD-dependent epimerase/dehydratase family protein [Bacteroidales bacterium]|nr:NAD-dependent epimerase/dehydratase family protein [Bacteroidales bacterium]HLN53293.1 NAD-dependent epimerase/dehydratase family protein [Lentimicrobium sp.]